MRKLIHLCIAAAAGLSLAGLTHAQETNTLLFVPATKLEAFETNTGTVIIKATAPIGNVSAQGGSVSVRCREITDAGTGRRATGIIVDIGFGEQAQDTMLVDYEELDSLLEGLDFIVRLDWTVTSLSGFDAAYVTKGGFRAVAFGSRRTGSIEYSVRSTRGSRRSLLLSRDQLAQLRSLIEQGKAKLDSLGKGK